MPNSLGTMRDLVSQIGTPVRTNPVVWIVGSGLTCSTPSLKGVPGSNDMVARIRSLVGRHDPAELEKFDRQTGGTIANSYKEAFGFAKTLFPPNVIDRVVREAVLESYSGYQGNSTAAREDLLRGDYNLCRAAVSRDFSQWVLRDGLRKFGAIAKADPDLFGRTILTTNFDPLVEVALFCAGCSPVISIIDEDGALGHNQTDHVQVVHLHGNWFASGTLHSNTQLAKRPRLEGTLFQLLRRSDVCILGYGGWEDSLLRALTMAARMPNNNQIYWCFYSADEREIEQDNPQVYDLLTEGGNVQGFLGIDGDRFFAELLEYLSRTRPAQFGLVQQSSLEQERVVQTMIIMQQERDFFEKENAELSRKLLDLESNSAQLVRIEQVLVGLADEATRVSSQNATAIEMHRNNYEVSKEIVRGVDALNGSWTHQMREHADRVGTEILTVNAAIEALNRTSGNRKLLAVVFVAVLAAVLAIILSDLVPKMGG